RCSRLPNGDWQPALTYRALVGILCSKRECSGSKPISDSTARDNLPRDRVSQLALERDKRWGTSTAKSLWRMLRHHRATRLRKSSIILNRTSHPEASLTSVAPWVRGLTSGCGLVSATYAVLTATM